MDGLVTSLLYRNCLFGITDGVKITESIFTVFEALLKLEVDFETLIVCPLPVYFNVTFYSLGDMSELRMRMRARCTRQPLVKFSSWRLKIETVQTTMMWLK